MIKAKPRITSIPDKFKGIAELLIKGAGDNPRDALVALGEAKLRGVFEEKRFQTTKQFND